MRTHDISIPTRKKPLFPRLCVVCEKADPNSTMELSILGADTGSLTEGVAGAAFDLASGSSNGGNTTLHIDGIPVCFGCESSLKWYHRLFKLATYTISLPALLLMLVMPGPIWIRVIIFVAIIIAPPILTIIFPPAFGATILNGNANFEFRSKTIALQFADLNGVVIEDEPTAA